MNNDQKINVTHIECHYVFAPIESTEFICASNGIFGFASVEALYIDILQFEMILILCLKVNKKV